MRRSRRFIPFARSVLGVALLLAAATGQARKGEPPYSLAHPAKAGFDVAIVDVAGVDAPRRRIDADRAMRTAGSKRMRSADARPLSITPERDGRWDTLEDGSRLWRVRVRAAGATDLRFAFAVAAFADVMRGGAAASGWKLSTIRALAAGAAGNDVSRKELVELIDKAIAVKKTS